MATGTTTLKRRLECTNGKGNDRDGDDGVCWKCHGHGKKYQKRTRQYDGNDCGVCQGTGKRCASPKSRILAHQPGRIVSLRGYPPNYRFVVNNDSTTTSSTGEGRRNIGGGFAGVPAFLSSNKSIPSFLLPKDGEIVASLGCGDWRIYQLANGHKLTVDDFVCAWIASTEIQTQLCWKGTTFGNPPVFSSPSTSTTTTTTTTKRRFKHVDLGCGCGSVLMTLLWAFPDTIQSYGVEAQDISFRLLQKGLQWNLGTDGSPPSSNGTTDTTTDTQLVQVWNHDLRNWQPPPSLVERVDLVTGTPPYFPLDRFVASENHDQKVHCRIPVRGAASDYIRAASKLLVAEKGRLVLVETAEAMATQAVWDTAQELGMFVVKRIDVITRQGLPPRFSCWVMGKTKKNESQARQDSCPSSVISTFTLRRNDDNNSRTKEYVAAMEAMGWIDFEMTYS